MHLVIREGRSKAVIFNDLVNLYSGQPVPVNEAPPECAVPPEVPPRWFVWPPQTRVLVAFDTVLSAGSRNLYGQISGLIRQNGIPFEVYALSYTADQRRGLKPAGYLLRDARRGGGTVGITPVL
jgi:hypothetical protein